MYHPDVLSDLGIQVPKTTSQFLAACRTAKAKGKYFLNLAGASAQNASLFATVLATSHVLAKDPGWNLKRITGKTTFAGTPEWRRTLQRIVDMKDAGCFPPGAEANDNIPATPGFVTGQVVSWTLPSSIIGLLKSFNKEAKYNFFAMPGETAADTRVNASPTDAFAVWSKTTNKAAAFKLIDFMLGLNFIHIASIRKTPCASARPSSSIASAAVIVRGFSQSTLLPALIARSA